MQFRRPHPPNVSINIAPLVDVVFLLVIFFAVSTTFLETSGLELELPSSTSTTEREPQQLTVSLAADGSVSFDGEIIGRKELGQQLRDRLADEGTSQKVVLQADEGTRHGDVVRVIDVIRTAGAAGISVAARPATDE